MSFTVFTNTRQVAFEMLRDRNYIVSEEREQVLLALTEDDPLEDENYILEIFEKKNGIKIIVIWCLNENIGVSTIHECMKRMDERQVQNAIIVKQGKITSAAQTALTLEPTKTLQIFDIFELKNNLTRHSMVPKHELVNPTESQHLLDQYKISRLQLPRISIDDPVIKYYGWKRGHIVKIHRKTGPYYRCII